MISKHHNIKLWPLEKAFRSTRDIVDYYARFEVWKQLRDTTPLAGLTPYVYGMVQDDET